MDQFLIAALAAVAFMIFVGGYYVGISERASRDAPVVHSGTDDLERRVRRVL